MTRASPLKVMARSSQEAYSTNVSTVFVLFIVGNIPQSSGFVTEPFAFVSFACETRAYLFAFVPFAFASVPLHMIQEQIHLELEHLPVILLLKYLDLRFILFLLDLSFILAFWRDK